MKQPEHENQLEFVRKQMLATPRNEWAAVAVNAKLSPRTVYNVVNPQSTPGYLTVFSLYKAIKARSKKK